MATRNTAKTAKKATQKTHNPFTVGDRVKWDSSGGTSVGTVVKVATSVGRIKTFTYKASKDDPRFIVETEEGKHAAHRAAELRKA